MPRPCSRIKHTLLMMHRTHSVRTLCAAAITGRTAHTRCTLSKWVSMGMTGMLTTPQLMMDSLLPSSTLLARTSNRRPKGHSHLSLSSTRWVVTRPRCSSQSQQALSSHWLSSCMRKASMSGSPTPEAVFTASSTIKRTIGLQPTGTSASTHSASKTTWPT